MTANWQTIPVFITNFNNLTRGFAELYKWLSDLGMTDINVIDNHSTYQPLLDFYRDHKVHVISLPENLGPYALWDIGMGQTMKCKYIVTDPDVVPDARCPKDIISLMAHVMSEDESVVKVGPSLRIDNLPDCYKEKSRVLDWEKQFWQRHAQNWRAYHAQIDTTFALYRPGSGPWPGGSYLRLAPPYQFEHRPWYEDSANLSEELLFYRKEARAKWINW